MPVSPIAVLILAIAAPVLAAAERIEAGRPVYRHSIVDGGVQSRDELAEARKADPVALAHYRQVDEEHVQLVTLARERLGYISYRVDGRVFWTKRPVRIHAGETVLCDGHFRIRARSGGMISDRPMSPVRLQDPPAKDFDRTIPTAPHIPTGE